MDRTVMLCAKGKWGEFPVGWLYEPKLDGTRALAFKGGGEGGKVKIVGRNGQDYTEKFPEIVADLKTYTHGFIIDGEIVGKTYTALAGRTHLEDKFKIEMRKRLEPCDLCAFDIINLDGADLTRFPYTDRKDTLYELGERPRIKIVRPLPLEVLLEKVKRKEIEGVVAKDPNSHYEFRRSPAWVKFRPEQAQDFLIIGYEDTDKPTRPYRSLIFTYKGREVQASSGLSEADLELSSQLFAKEPKRQVGTKWYFLKPRFYAEVLFSSGEIAYRFPRIVKLKLENSQNRFFSGL